MSADSDELPSDYTKTQTLDQPPCLQREFLISAPLMVAFALRALDTVTARSLKLFLYTSTWLSAFSSTGLRRIGRFICKAYLEATVSTAYLFHALRCIINAKCLYILDVYDSLFRFSIFHRHCNISSSYYSLLNCIVRPSSVWTNFTLLWSHYQRTSSAVYRFARQTLPSVMCRQLHHQTGHLSRT